MNTDLAAERTTGIYADQVKPKLPRLPAFVDGKDDLDSWLLCFDKFGNTSGWPKENWCTSLPALLTGRGLEVFSRLSETEAIDYDRVKEVPQKRYNLTEDVHTTAFVTMLQHYQSLRMPFGMVNSGMTMVRAVRKLLDGMDNVVYYIDDLLVHTMA